MLGIEPGASREQMVAAYRRQAKRWHPDVAGTADAAGRMAQVNAAYDLLRSEQTHHARATQDAPRRSRWARSARPERGAWLPESVRRALGPELLAPLEPGEAVSIVTPMAMWASPSALLAVSDRRLLWLLDDVVMNRVRDLRYALVEDVRVRAGWPLRRRAKLSVRARGGRSFTFADLRPATAELVAAQVETGRAAHARAVFGGVP